MKTKYLLLASALCVVTTPAFAQDATPTANDPQSVATPQDEPEQELVITGSRIPRNTYDNPTPTTTLDNADIAESGDSELSETLADIPSLSSTTNEATVTGNVQNSGLSAIQLRNLGDNRTLVLIDGRRTVSNSGIGNRVSISTIPSDFVDRVEIITGGASSVYGSDAVAGVVNIITESRQRGFKVNARYGITEDGDGEERTFNASYGTRFASNRGYFLISGTYDQDFGIRATDREWATRPVSYQYDFTRVATSSRRSISRATCRRAASRTPAPSRPIPIATSARSSRAACSRARARRVIASTSGARWFRSAPTCRPGCPSPSARRTTATPATSCPIATATTSAPDAR